MTSGATHPSAVLAAARRLRAEADAAEAGVLLAAVEWAAIHEVTDLAQGATWRDTPVPLAGEGTPQVSEFAVIELAAALGMSTDAGKRLVSEAMELAHRLPRHWARVQAGTLVAWKARGVAAATLDLSPDAAAFVDAQVAGFAHRVGNAQLQRLVDTAIAQFMPEYAEERRQASADQRHVAVETSQVSFNGTTVIHGELDLADALDLDEALKAGAAQLADLGSSQSLNVRRAEALGLLARGETVLSLTQPDVEPTPAGPTRAAPTPARRDLTLYLHLDAESEIAEVEGRGLITRTQIEQWLHLPDTNVTIKPVIDLNKTSETDRNLGTHAYAVPHRINEHVTLRDRTCVFPWCTRNARRCDVDHVVPYAPDARPRQTAVEKLAPLCRRHHRLKTHSAWSYSVIAPGSYLWRSPRGYTYLRDPDGTEDLTLRRVDPPGG